MSKVTPPAPAGRREADGERERRRAGVALALRDVVDREGRRRTGTIVVREELLRGGRSEPGTDRSRRWSDVPSSAMLRPADGPRDRCRLGVPFEADSAGRDVVSEQFVAVEPYPIRSRSSLARAIGQLEPVSALGRPCSTEAPPCRLRAAIAMTCRPCARELPATWAPRAARGARSRSVAPAARG